MRHRCPWSLMPKGWRNGSWRCPPRPACTPISSRARPIRFITGGQRPPIPAPIAVYRYDLAKRKEDTLLDAASRFEISADTKRALVQVKDDLHIVDLGDKLDLAKFKLKLDAVRVRVDPLAEWPQIFQEAWSVNRDYFYDPGFHGADWNAVRQKYEVFMPHLAARSDLFRVIRWMLSELAVGHSYQSPGDKVMELESVPGGLLGADYEVANGRYRFQKVFGGLNWNADLRSP